jgi:8-oxo-dGTP pyrophosphatase MutT (NUDIX family)
MELFDVLDSEGKKTGRTMERGQSMSPGERFLIVDVWIINSKGEFLISKRVPTAKPAPNKWQPTTGCVIAGESSLAGALRETQEELGIILDPQNGRKLKRYLVWDSAFIDVWLFEQEVDIDTVVLQPRETADAKWATVDCIRGLCANGEFLSSRSIYYDELFKEPTPC